MNAQTDITAAQPGKEMGVEIAIRADCAVLSGHLFRPPGQPRAAAVLHGATGVPQSYYRAFASWLAAEQGIACLTYDYRDFATSAVAHPRKSRATMATWGIADQTAAQTALEQAAPGVPLWAIGHSLGGMMLPFQDGAGRLDRVITVAAGLVSLRDHPWPYRALAAGFWHGFGPVLTTAMGYMPGRALGIGEDLPGGVYWQWRRWCTGGGYLMRDVGRGLPVPDWRRVTAPTKIVAVADDVMVPPNAVWRLMQCYTEAPKRQLTLSAHRFGLSSIGHIAAFAPRNAVVWPELIA